MVSLSYIETNEKLRIFFVFDRMWRVFCDEFHRNTYKTFKSIIDLRERRNADVAIAIFFR